MTPIMRGRCIRDQASLSGSARRLVEYLVEPAGGHSPKATPLPEAQKLFATRALFHCITHSDPLNIPAVLGAGLTIQPLRIAGRNRGG